MEEFEKIRIDRAAKIWDTPIEYDIRSDQKRALESLAMQFGVSVHGLTRGTWAEQVRIEEGSVTFMDLVRDEYWLPTHCFSPISQRLDVVDLGGFPELRYFGSKGLGFMSVNLSRNARLKQLVLRDEHVLLPDLSKCTELQEVRIESVRNFTRGPLDLSHCAHLERVYVSSPGRIPVYVPGRQLEIRNGYWGPEVGSMYFCSMDLGEEHDEYR